MNAQEGSDALAPRGLVVDVLRDERQEQPVKPVAERGRGFEQRARRSLHRLRAPRRAGLGARAGRRGRALAAVLLKALAAAPDALCERVEVRERVAERLLVHEKGASVVRVGWWRRSARTTAGRAAFAAMSGRTRPGSACQNASTSARNVLAARVTGSTERCSLLVMNVHEVGGYIDGVAGEFDGSRDDVDPSASDFDRTPSAAPHDFAERARVHARALQPCMPEASPSSEVDTVSNSPSEELYPCSRYARSRPPLRGTAAWVSTPRRRPGCSPGCRCLRGRRCLRCPA